jgi:prephenate dehydrogenase
MPNPQSAIRNPQSGEPLFRRMTVVGAGLIGGSLGLAARQAGAVGTIIGVNRSAESRQTALRLGLVDEATEDLAAGVREADLVVLAVPVHRIVALIPEVARHAPESCLVTDVGSVKSPILQAGDAAFPDGRFVAGHPIAGQERSGPAAARADLFQGATWILTPSARTRPEAVERVTALCGAAAAQVVRMDAAWHDEVFATVSHLPHLVAYALMDAVLHTERGEERLRYSAGGLRDFTRVAGSDPDMWRDIFLMNREALLRSVTAYREAVTRLEDAIRIGNGEVLRQQLLQARIAREELLHRS